MALRILAPETTSPEQASTQVRYSLILAPGQNADAFARQIDEVANLTDGATYDVVIVDRGLSPLVTRVLSTLEGDVEVVTADADMSFADVCNQIASHAGGDRLVFVSPEARLYPGWLRYIDEAFRFNPMLSVVRSADSDIVSLAPSTFASFRGFNEDSISGREIDDLCIIAATQGIAVGFDRNRAMGRSELRWKFLTNGYVVLKNFVEPDVCDRIIAEGEAYYATQNVDPRTLNRVMNFHNASPTARQHLTGERFNAVLRELYAEDPLFLQTILFFEGSQQPLHSDWIYMSTDRHHRLMGTWLALEDVQEDAGPLRYLPGSHTLPIESIAERWARIGPESEAKLARGEFPPEGWLGKGHESGRYGYLYDG